MHNDYAGRVDLHTRKPGYVNVNSPNNTLGVLLAVEKGCERVLSTSFFDHVLGQPSAALGSQKHKEEWNLGECSRDAVSSDPEPPQQRPCSKVLRRMEHLLGRCSLPLSPGDSFPRADYQEVPYRAQPEPASL